MGLTYLTPLNPQLSINIAYVGSFFKHCSVQLFYTFFAIQPRPALTAVTPNLAQSNFVVLYSLGERVRFRLGDLHLTIKDQEQSWLEEIVQDIFLSRVSIY